MRRVYLDVCCLNRPFDDQMQERVRLEAEAVTLILNRVEAGVLTWVSGEVIDLEVGRIPDPDRRARIQSLVTKATVFVPIDEQIRALSAELTREGIGPVDALHLACAQVSSDVFLTTDDRLARRAARLGDVVTVKVVNPLRWLEEGVGE